MMDENLWNERGDLGEVFIDWSAYAYGDTAYGVAAKPAFTKRLSTSQAIIHNQDNREHDLLDSDDYYQFEGGISAAIHMLTGKDAAIYHNDHSLPERPVIRSLKQEIARVVQARASNPKWIEGVMRHGYKGAFEIAASVDYLFAFAATTSQVDDHHFTKCFDAYIMDDKVCEFLQATNRDAYQDILKKFKDALDRGLWKSPRNWVYDHLTHRIE